MMTVKPKKDRKVTGQEATATEIRRACEDERAFCCTLCCTLL